MRELPILGKPSIAYTKHDNTLNNTIQNNKQVNWVRSLVAVTAKHLGA